LIIQCQPLMSIIILLFSLYLLQNRGHQSSHQRYLGTNTTTTVDPSGRTRLTIKKSRPILGIAIEGGADVAAQTQPRIICVHVSCDTVRLLRLRGLSLIMNAWKDHLEIEVQLVKLRPKLRAFFAYFLITLELLSV